MPDRIRYGQGLPLEAGFFLRALELKTFVQHNGSLKGDGLRRFVGIAFLRERQGGLASIEKAYWIALFQPAASPLGRNTSWSAAGRDWGHQLFPSRWIEVFTPLSMTTGIFMSPHQVSLATTVYVPGGRETVSTDSSMSVKWFATYLTSFPEASSMS